MRRAAAVVGSLGFVLPGLVIAAAGHVLVSLVPLAIGSLLLAAGLLRQRRATVALCLALVTAAAWIVARLELTRAPVGWRVCDNDECRTNGPWWSRLVPEPASLDSGLLLTRIGGQVSAEERSSYSRAFARQLAELPPGPNALLLSSNARALRRIEIEPPGTDKLPCVVFLHGFGGLSSAYLRVMEKALPRAIIVAPALDVDARWDSALGRSVVERTLASLPIRADRARTVLLGLSNGAVFGAGFAPKFSGAVFVSGLGQTEATKRPLQVVSGGRDVRLTPDWIEARVAELRGAGVPVDLEIVPDADHALLLTHSERWAAAVRRVLE
jgi:pimeloyl-ACP methyl ester carboxylesterase